MTLALRRELRQQHALTPRLQRAVQLLQLSSLEFADEVRALASTNPFLEEAESDEDATTAASLPSQEAAARAVTETSSDPSLESIEQETPRNDEMDGPDLQAEAWTMEVSSTGRRSDDAEGEFTDMLPCVRSLREHLHGQLDVLTLPERDRILAKAVVESLDDDGYLRTDLIELVDVVGFDPPAGEDELRVALRRVQALEPAGVGARSVSECLLLQLAHVECSIRGGLARRIVTDHLQDLVARDVSAMAAQLGCSLDDAEQACAHIRRLDPHPGWAYGAPASRFITPDVVVRRVRDRWVVRLNPAIVPKVRMNQVYAQLFQRHRDSSHAELAAHLQEAKWTMRTVEQRFMTILDVADAIVRKQHLFFDFGPMAMKPLGLREIATELGLHESTVSRVTNNKFMATPSGVFELKYFFSRGMKTAGGGHCSPTAIRGLVKEMIENELETDRLSDAEIARRLARQGLVVARRTVTKYRQALRLETAEVRARSLI